MRWNRFIPLLFFLTNLSAQTVAIVDTISVSPNQQIIQLKPLILDASLSLFYNGKLVENYELNEISGVLKFRDNNLSGGTYLASYQYFTKSLPLKIGPIFKTLPELDSLIIVRADSVPISPKNTKPTKLGNESDLATTGTVFRNLTISPLGGSDFSGGLQLQLQGKLSNQITVSGVLSDQSLPIQPEGTTQTLDEIDKVYLHVSHPVFQIMAGDIDYQLQSGKYLNINRKLEGLKNTFKYGKWSGQSALAGTRGRYHKLSFKGNDGSQGPYSLTSETGNRDIIVLAGTEKVHLDGNLLKRGENFDYIIDYSIGEITFTPRNLIDFDSDIFIEYEYSDFQYTRNVLSSSIYRKFGDWGELGISWFKEKDQLQFDDTVAIDLRDSLRVAGDDDTIIPGSVLDADGDYLLVDGIYIYSPNTDNLDAQKYKVSFQNDGNNGEYVRRISADGSLFFEYISIEDRLEVNDLYSPFRRWSNPVNHEILQVAGSANIAKTTTANWDISLSNLDKNTFSNIDDNDNVGLAYNFEIDGRGLQLSENATLGYKIVNWHRAEKFSELSRERDTHFNRDWNILTDNGGKESLFSSGLNFKIDKYLESNFNWSRYNSVLKNKTRMTARINSITKYVPIFNSYINRVDADNSNFYQFEISGTFLPGAFHPILKYEGEYKKNNHKFDIEKFGFAYSKKNKSISASITRRNDWEAAKLDSSQFEKIQDGIFAELDINGRFKNGWNGKIVFKKRISDDLIKNEKLNYAIGIANISFNNKTNPLRWELHSKLEETFTESRAVVYDSIGVGFGTHRFDAEFNEYISDPNGAYISHAVLTGDRELITHLIASQRISVDFAKTSFSILKNFDFRSDLRAEFKGKSLALNKITEPELLDKEIARSKLNFRNEIDYNPQSSTRRVRNWVIYSQDLLGADPRGNDLRNRTEYGIEWREPLKKQFHSTLKFESHFIENSSGFSELRDRNVDGWWVEEDVKWTIERKWQFAISTLGGKDTGNHNQESFSAYAYGLKLESQRFINSTSQIKIRTEIFNSIEKKDKSTIPPEALNGLPIGQSISINIQGQVLLGKNLSLNLTGSYIDNTRYNNFITLSGEIRAYF